MALDATVARAVAEMREGRMWRNSGREVKED